MIVDHLSNLFKYAFLNKHIHHVVEFLNNTDLLTIPQGRLELDGDEVFLLRETYPSKKEIDCFFEGHQKYLDIQIVIRGSEYIGYSNKNNKNINVTHPYLEEKDVEKYQVKDFTKVHLYDGMFAMVFPDDLHMPKLEKDESMIIEKAVFKIKLQENKE